MVTEEKKLPDGWRWAKLEDVTQVLGGGTPKTGVKDYWDGDVVWLSPTDLPKIGEIVEVYDSAKHISQRGLQSSSARLLPEGAVLYSSRASIGKIGVAAKKMATNQGFTNFICSDQVNNRFLAYLLSYYTPEIEKLSNSTTFKEVNKTAMRNFEIPLPRFFDQKRIVAKLDDLFSKLDAAIEKMEAESLMESDFFSSSLTQLVCSTKDGPMTGHLGDFVDFVGGSQPPKSTFSLSPKDGYVRLIQIRDYKTDKYKVYVSSKHCRRFCNSSDVMIGRYGPPVFQILRGLEGAYNVALMKAIPKIDRLDNNFLFYFLQNSHIQDYIIGLSQRSAGQSGVNKRALEQYAVTFPSLEEQRLIVRKLNSLHALIAKLNTSSRLKRSHLQALKKSILHAAFNGDL